MRLVTGGYRTAHYYTSWAQSNFQRLEILKCLTAWAADLLHRPSKFEVKVEYFLALCETSTRQ